MIRPYVTGRPERVATWAVDVFHDVNPMCSLSAGEVCRVVATSTQIAAVLAPWGEHEVRCWMVSDTRPGSHSRGVFELPRDALLLHAYVLEKRGDLS